jgi:hypothetical protein
MTQPEIVIEAVKLPGAGASLFHFQYKDIPVLIGIVQVDTAGDTTVLAAPDSGPQEVAFMSRTDVFSLGQFLESAGITSISLVLPVKVEAPVP